MAEEPTKSPMRLKTLSAIASEFHFIEQVERKLLEFCIDKQLRAYIAISPNQVAVIYQSVMKSEQRALFRKPKTVVVSHRRPVVERHIRYVALDQDDLLAIRDASSVKVEGFQHGGFESAGAGLVERPFDYCVIRRSSSDPFRSANDLSPERLLEGQVYPIVQVIEFDDLLVSEQSGLVLEELLGVDDKWGHKEAAPSVYLVYCAAKLHPDESAEFIADYLVKNDEHHVFTDKVAEFAAQVIKKDLRSHIEKNIPVEKLSVNETGKDYSDPSLSSRLGLLLLATDCWIHDQRLAETQSNLRGKREELSHAWSAGIGEAELKKRLLEAHATEEAARKATAGKLFLPNGLKAYLTGELKFKETDKENNQVEYLRRIIQNEPSKRHAKTAKAAEERMKKAGPKRPSSKKVSK